MAGEPARTPAHEAEAAAFLARATLWFGTAQACGPAPHEQHLPDILGGRFARAVRAAQHASQRS